MKKLFFLIVTVLCIFSLVGFKSSAQEKPEEEKFWDDFVDILPESAEISEKEEVLSSVGIDSLFYEIISAFSGKKTEIASFFLLVFGVSVIMSVADAMPIYENSSLIRHTSMAVSLVSSALVFSRLLPIAASIRDSLFAMTDFFSSVIPILTGILAAGGSVNSASVQAFNMNVTMALISKISTSLLIPLSLALFTLSLLASLDSASPSALAKGIRGIFMWILGIGATVIIGAVSMQTVIGTAKDSAYLRAAKYAASGMIPVVGSTVSGALATLAGGLAYIKSVIGIYAVFVMLIMSLTPLITLLLYRLAFSVSLSFLEYVGSSAGVRTVSAFRASIDALISVYAVSIIVYICEIVVFMKCGVNVFG